MAQRTIKLLRELNYGGRKLAAGSQMVLDERKAEWLVEQGAAEAIGWTAERAALLTPPRAAVSAKASSAKAPARTGCRGCGSAR